MAKKDKKEEIPSWIKDLYKEDLDRVVRGERPMYFRGMNDDPLKNVSPEFDILSGGAAVKGMNGIRGTLSPLNNGMGNYNFSFRGINKKIGELVDEAGLYLPEKLRPIYQTVVDAMSRSKDKGLGHITQPLANALYPADERRNRRLDGEHPVGYVDAIDGIWPREKYGLWGEKIERKAEGGPAGNDPMYVRQDVSDRASYLKDIIGNAIRRRLYENVTPDVVASNASLPDKVKEFIYGRNGKANVDEYSEQLWGRFLSQPNSLDGNSKEIRIPDNIIADIERMFNRDTKDEIKRLDKKIHDTEQEIYGSDKPATDDAYGRLKLLKKSREWVDVFEKNRNSVRSGKPTVFSEYDFYPEAAGELTPLSGFGNFTIYRRPDGRLGVYDIYDFYSNDQEFPINIATKVLDAIGDKFEERGSFKDYNPAPESGKDALIRNAITSKNKLEDKQEGGYIDDDYDIEWIVGESIPSNISIKKYIGGGGINEDSNIPEDDLRRLYSDDLKKVINGDKAVYFGNLNDKPVHNVHPELFLFPAINAMVGAVDSIDDIRKGRYSDVVVDIAMGFLPDVLRKASKKAIRGVIDSVVSSDLFSSVFLEKKRGQDIVNTLMRNREWNNFLNGINGDNYYRLQKKKGAESYMDDEKLFVSHTTPWEEFIPDGSEGTSHKFLYELPTSLLGRRYGSNDKGYIGDTMVDEMGFNHLMYGDRSSGRRGFVRVIDDENAQKIGIDPYIIGISDRPLKNRGFYDNHPYYENVLQGNQTIVEGSELKDVLINGTYNLYERTRNGIQKTIHIGDGKGGLIQRKDGGGPVESGRDYGSGKYVIDPRRSEDSKMAVYDEIWDYLTDKKGIPQTQAIGILSNIAAESGGDTEALGPAGDFGIQQWLGPRKKELQRRYGKKPTLTQQLDYLVDEYQGRVPGLGWNYINQGKFFDKDAQGNIYNYYMYSKADFDNATNYKDATVAWNQGYGRPLGSTLRNEKRLEFADIFSDRYGVPENEPMRYEFGQRDSGTGDGGQQPVPETVASAAPSLAPHPSMDSWWEKEGQDLLYKMLAQSGANKKAIEDIANNIKNDPQSEAQIAETERMRKEQAKRQLVLNMIPGLMLNIKGMSSTKSEGGPVGDNRWFYDEVRRKQVIDKQNTMQSLSEEKHKILRSSRLALEQGFIDEDQFRRINNLPVFKLSDDVKYDGRNNREVDLINSLFDTAMYDSFGKSVKEQSVEEEKNRKERFYPYKLMADSLLTIGDIATASPGFLRLIERSGARLYPLLNNIAHSNSIQKISGLSGIGVDSSQIALDPDDDNLWNILGVAGAAAELIGGMDILRNTSVMGRIGNRLDDILDIANPVVTLGGLADDVLN